MDSQNHDMDASRAREILYNEAPFLLAGSALEEGDHAPHFIAVDLGLSSAFITPRGRTRVVATITSLDLDTCAEFVRRLDSLAARYPAVAFLLVTMDLPFHVRTWAAKNNITRLELLSDYRDAAMGVAYGVLIHKLRLLTRSVFVLDKLGAVVHRDVATSLAHTPDLDALDRVLADMNDAPRERCGCQEIQNGKGRENG